MSSRLQRSLQALLLLLLGLFLGSRLWTGQITWYINARFLPLTLLGTAGLLLMARALYVEREPRHEGDPEAGLGAGIEHSHEGAGPGHPHEQPPASAATPMHWGLVIFLVPLIVGLVVPHRPLGSEALANRGLSAVAPLQAAGSDQPLQLELAPTNRTILDWIRTFNLSTDPASQVGLPADVIGFAYHDPRLPDGQVLLGRFALTCCVADATAIGLIVEWPGAQDMLDNAWYRVQGPISLASLDGQSIPLIRAEQVDEVPMPEQPYLYN